MSRRRDTVVLDRRVFLRDLGWGAVGLVISPLAACSTPPTQVTTSLPSPSVTTGARAGTTLATQPEPGAVVRWERVDLGFVSAYVLARGGEAAVVDTGVAGSADAIEEVLVGMALGWESVGHVILTHSHRDHVGSIAQVLERAGSATAYAGVDDIPDIDAPRTVEGVSDGDIVFGLEIIATPGHTPGHICVLDPAGGVLVAGDALNGSDGGVAGPNPEFTADMDAALRSVVKLAALRFDTLLFGHGEPVEGEADQAVASLVASS
jgi:glyoxylase-like metal-dependent hydrolase (beta-lactamase superfamily II)